MRRFTVLASLIVVAWLGVGAWAGPLAGSLSEVATNDAAAFLPADAEATRVQQLATAFEDRQAIPAVVVYERAGGITAEDSARIAADAQRIAEVTGVFGPLPPPVRSDDGQAVELVVPLDSSGAEGNEIDGIVENVRAAVQGRDGLAVYVTGPAGLLADQVAVFRTIDVTLLLVTASVVVVILLIIYRSPVLWLLPLISVAIAYSGAGAAVYYLAREGIIDLNGQSQGILTVLIFGAGTDYALLLIARYREELHRHDSPARAILIAVRRAAPAIVASGGTVIAGLLCLLVSSLNSNRSLGPVAAIGIAVTMLVLLTLLPALLLLGGRWAFWPRRVRAATPVTQSGWWTRVAGLIERHARTTWIVTTLALLALSVGLIRLDTSTLGQADSFVSRPDSVAGQEALSRHFPGGTGSPALIFARAESAEQVSAAAAGVPGVTGVRIVPANPAQPTDPKVVDGRVQVQATLAAPSESREAEETVASLRAAVHSLPDAEALVGGPTAVSLDTRIAADRDRNVIIPLVLVVIAVILALLLRALLAPVLLIATVVLSFAATLGLCGLLFTYAFGFAGTDPSFPLFAFVFLVALGIDYNIFLMTRVREETLRHGPHQGVLRGLIVTGGVITSAGVVLAATFSTLAVLPLVVLVELGVAVALGVLIDTVVVRALLVPALTYDIGRPMWWPSHGRAPS